MKDYERDESSIASEIYISERSPSSQHTTELFLFDGDGDSASSASIRRQKNGSNPSDAEWQNLSKISLTVERVTGASRFLNPSPTKSRSFTYSHFDIDFQSLNHSDGAPKTERMASESHIPTNDRGHNRPPQHVRHHTSPSIIITSLVLSNRREHIRSCSGTPTVMGIREALPDLLELEQMGTPTPPNSACVSFASANIRDVKSVHVSVADDNWSDDWSDDFVAWTKQESKLPKTHIRSQSRRGSEIHPPKEIWISGGPSPGLYVNMGRENGRLKWIGDHAYLSWSPNARAWLLISRNTKRNDSALAMLCVDSNNPCITNIKWRVGIGAKRGVVYSFYDSYAFRVDSGMACTRYYGNEKISAASLIQESTLVKVKRGLGVIRFVGQLQNQNGIFAGIELFTPTGLNNGSIDDCFYFEAKPKHGVFVRIPGAIKQIYGAVTDRIVMFLDDLIMNAKKIVDISEAKIERLMKCMVLFEDGSSLFYAHRIKLLGIIFYFELVML